MNPDSIKPAGLPQTDQVATPPSGPTLTMTPPQTETHDQPPAKTELPKKNLPTQQVPKMQKNNSNVTLAIIATMVIVLGIAALAVYAYLKQH